MKKFKLLVWLISSSVAFGQLRYEIVNLEEMGLPGTESSTARGINNNGQVVGSYWNPSVTESRLFTYSLGTGATDLGVGPVPIMFARGINDSGQISAWGGANGMAYAYRYTQGTGYQTLNVGGADAEPGGINNHGQVTGWATYPDGEHAFRYTDARGTESLGGASVGRAINDHGDVTGTINGQNVLLYRDSAGATILGPGIGWAINDQGVVAGETSLTPVGGEAFIYLNGSMQLLGTLGRLSDARGINNRNDVVGYSYTLENQIRAFLWNEQEGMQDLNSLIDPASGWNLLYAFDINDSGQIVGLGTYRGKDVAFLLNPVPEPSTWALLALGPSALFLRRRKV